MALEPIQDDYLQQQGDFSIRVTPMECHIEATFVGPYSKVIGELYKYEHGFTEYGAAELEGNNNYIKNLLDQFNINPTGGGEETSWGFRDPQAWYMNSMRATRKKGGLGELHVDVTGCRRITMVSLDFETFSRPILGYVFPDESTDEAILRVNKIQKWSNMQHTNHLKEYIKYQYDIPSDSTSPQSTDESYFLIESSGHAGYARKIAAKMRKGIDSFDRYIPILTVTRISTRLPVKESGDSTDMFRVTMVGTQGSMPSIPAKGVIAQEELENIISEVEDSLEKIANANPLGGGEGDVTLTWQVFGDTLTVDQNYVFTRTILFRGITEADTDLYPDRSKIAWEA